MFWTLPSYWIAILNTIAWPIIQISVGYLITKIAWQRFSPRMFFFRPWFFEQRYVFYERCCGVRHWKNLLPDGAKLFDAGFPKASLQRRDPAYLQRFAYETVRGELAHWLDLLFVPLFLLWNPPWAFAIMALTGMILNLPCIIVQRYNRQRLLNLPQLFDGN